MEPKPQNQNQEHIKHAIDGKARIIAEECGGWNAEEIKAGMSAATRNEWSDADHAFYEAYAEWRSSNPIILK
jgi:hypothetical protein